MLTYCFLAINKYNKLFRLKRPTFSKYEPVFLITARQRSCGKVDLSFHRCLFVHGGYVSLVPRPFQRVSMSGWDGYYSPSWTWDLRGGYSLTTRETTRYGRQAGSTHPTGMLSCFQILVSILLRIFSIKPFNYSYNNNIWQKF